MSNIQEKKLFSERLQLALKEAQHPISPTYLSREFNYRYDGTPVSVQSANNWLLGKAIPSQDKLLLLSTWLNVSSQWLRFGENTSRIQLNDINLNTSEQTYIYKFRSLNLSQQKVIKELIDQFTER